MQIVSFFFTIIKSLAAVVAITIALVAHPSPSTFIPPQPTTSTSTVPFPIASSTSVTPANSASHSPSISTGVGTRVQQTSSTSVAAPRQSAQTSSTPPLPSAQLNTQTRAALVNILCTVAGNQFEPISGSGVIIDSRGIILTNAHVGQFLLLRDYGAPDNIDCVVRTGSPAEETYTATLLYLPPEWVEANASQLKAQTATGTGQNDYSFILIRGTTNPAATLPTTFPYISMSTAAPDIGEEMLLAAYPAGFLSGQLISEDLYASSAVAYVTELFSFDSSADHVDLFSVGGSVVSQAGSSGGAAVRQDGTLAGIISTDTAANSTGERDLRAITLSHINSSLAGEGQGGIAQLLTGDVSVKASTFNTTIAPQETQELEAVLEQ